MSEETALALTVRQAATVIVPRTLAEVIDLAERLSKSTLLPDALKGKVPDVLMQIMAGQELGLYSMASLRSFNIISGKPVMSADAMVAVVLGSGKAEYVRRIEATDERATYATKRHGEPEQRCTWTMEMAKKAALHQKDNWRCYPRSQLSARAKSELMRDVYPDVLAGCFTVDEIADREPVRVETRGDGSDVLHVIDAEFTDSPTPPQFNPADYPEIGDLDTAITIEACREIAGRFAKRGLKPGHPAYEAINAKYKLAVAEIKKRPTSAGGSSAPPASTEPSSKPSETPSAASTAGDTTAPGAMS